MTTRNLNRTWRDVLISQYAADHEADVPFPIRYLIHAATWRQNIIVDVPTKIEPPTFRRAVFAFHRATHKLNDPTYQDEHISLLKPLLLLAVLLASSQQTASAWDFTIFADSECESSTPAPDHRSGTGDIDCTENTAPHKCFNVDNMSNCILYLYSTLDECQSDGDFQNVYDRGEEGEDIAPDYQWDAFKVEDC